MQAVNTTEQAADTAVAVLPEQDQVAVLAIGSDRARLLLTDDATIVEVLDRFPVASDGVAGWQFRRRQDARQLDRRAFAWRIYGALQATLSGDRPLVLAGETADRQAFEDLAAERGLRIVRVLDGDHTDVPATLIRARVRQVVEVATAERTSPLRCGDPTEPTRREGEGSPMSSGPVSPTVGIMHAVRPRPSGSAPIDVAPDRARLTAAATLQRLLPAILALAMDARQAQWNLDGAGAAELHQATADLIADADRWADRLARRSVAIGFAVDARPGAVAAASTGFPAGRVTTDEVADELERALHSVSAIARDALDHLGDADPVAHHLTVGLLEDLDEHRSRLRRHLPH